MLPTLLLIADKTALKPGPEGFCALPSRSLFMDPAGGGGGGGGGGPPAGFGVLTAAAAAAGLGPPICKHRQPQTVKEKCIVMPVKIAQVCTALHGCQKIQDIFPLLPQIYGKVAGRSQAQEALRLGAKFIFSCYGISSSHLRSAVFHNVYSYIQSVAHHFGLPLGCWG